jgi:thiamine-phosphate diphosphorylase
MMRIEPPIVCLVTDRRRLPAGDAGSRSVRERFDGLAHEAVAAGVDIIQVREPDLDTSVLVDLVVRLVEIARGSSTHIVVNDRLDVALTSGAAGVHLKAVSLPPAAARSIAPRPFIIGRSVHSVDEAVEHAADVDYVIAGTVFPTVSKPAVDQLLGAKGLADVVRAITRPVLAIGGVTVERLEEIAMTRAAGIAGIGLFLDESRTMNDIVTMARAQFDRAKARS